MDGDVKRDRWGRPLIKQPDDSEVAYGRPSKLADALDDKTALYLWETRTAVEGFLNNPDLAFAFLATEDKKERNQLCWRAKQEARADRKAILGSAVHSLAQRYDEGKKLPNVLPQYRDDIRAYIKFVKAHAFKYIAIERFMVCDELHRAGTPDRIGTFDLTDERPLIIDLKTGSVNPKYAFGEWAVQLATYAHSTYYDIETGERKEVPGLRTDIAYVLAVPYGEAKVDLYEVDIAAGWEDAKHAEGVFEYRKHLEDRAHLVSYPEKEDGNG